MSQLKIGLIGGSGMGAALATQDGIRHEPHTPFGKPSDAIIETERHGVPVFFLSRHGAGHTLNPSQVPFRANIYALKQLGCTHIIASGAVGSLREEFRPRDLVLPDQVIDKTFRRAGTFFDSAAVHVEFAEPFCPVLRQTLLDAAAQMPKGNAAVHDRGCYVCMEGPAFSTRAESLMHRLWGGDLIGMTAMPEAKLAREAEMSYALVALVTDYDCWQHRHHDAPADPSTLLSQIIANLQDATNHGIQLLDHAIHLIAQRQEQLLAAPAQNALKLAIWTDRAKIAPEEIQRLAPIWGRYFNA